MHRQKCAPVRVVASGGVRQEGNTRCRTRIGQLSRWHTKCAPKEEVRPGATIKVTEGGGADSGGTDSGGGLAVIGAEDGGALRALGLVVGTAILLGGAVFTFTPWRKLRGTR
ncbi:hypothetical protein [Streptomyces sp. S063]|uniref:hypothetical protein n=1 Tax=Streptomyces sp. S063 TaxID=2005885 RepID=UPI0010081296|nr:hypothetical protein [Streptomyces sp. S063]